MMRATLATEGLSRSAARATERLQRELHLAVDRAARATRAAAIQAVTAKYNIGTRALAPYIYVRRSSPGSGEIAASVTFQIKALPIEAFRPRVQMRAVTLTSSTGRTYSRKLPFILLRRYRDAGEKVIPTAFPMRQRQSGPLRAGDRIRRRTGTQREQLTNLRFYAMPRPYIENELLPAMREIAGEQLHIELRVAYRKSTSRGRVLRRND